MFIRTTTQKRNGKTYRYAQLVESARRESDGLPVHHVIAHLGKASTLEVENFRRALDASSKGKKVIVAPVSRSKNTKTKPTATLQYLDLAVLLACFRELGLDSLFEELLPPGRATVSPTSVVTALILQSCVCPSSDLSATQWLPYTALAEMLHIPLAKFNNTRIHRVLDQLEHVEPTLMHRLPKLIAEKSKQQPAFSTFFLDVTDTWYVGHGCSIAKTGKTKEGLLRRKIGIVLLCDENGYPLRWDVIQGTRYDGDVMIEMIRRLSGLDWAEKTPIVCDRSMGKSAYLISLLASGVYFLTAMSRHEFSTYAPHLPWEPFSKLPTCPEEKKKAGVELAASCAKQAGLKQVNDKLFVIDLKTAKVPDDSSSGVEKPDGFDDVTVAAMHYCQKMSDDVQQGRYQSLTAAGHALGLSKGLVFKYRKLKTLCQDIQTSIISGDAVGISLDKLISVAQINDFDDQREAYASLLSTKSKGKTTAHKPYAASAKAMHDLPENSPKTVRVVAYFNPELFFDRRQLAERRKNDIELFVKELNHRLSKPSSKKSESNIRAEVNQKLKKYDFLDVYGVKIIRTKNLGRSIYQVKLDFNQLEWQKRRRYDGFSVLVAHPEMKHSAETLCQLYRQKDLVEKDFGVIKGLLKLRPLEHRNEEKVRAHVSLRMFALLLERILHKKLKGRYSTKEALAHLQHCTVEYFSLKEGGSFYGIVTPNEQQGAILRVLRMAHLADDNVFGGSITPR